VISPVDQFGAFDHSREPRELLLPALHAAQVPASLNLLYRPIQNVTVGAEGLWGERINKDRATGADQRFQVSAQVKY
jgi:hypothetical protein